MIASILIDQREPLEVQLMKFGGAPTVVTLLEYGDLQVLCDDGALLVIERKTPDDLLNSIRDERLMNQCASLLSSGGWPYLIIDGQWHRSDSGKVMTGNRETGWSWQALQGVLLTIQELGVLVISSGGDFENTVLWLAKHSHSRTVKINPRRTAIFATPAEQVLAALPGIGPDKAEAILNSHNGNLTWALCSLLDPDWQKQEGVGPKTKDNLRALFALHENEILWPFENEQPKEKTQ